MRVSDEDAGAEIEAAAPGVGPGIFAHPRADGPAIGPGSPDATLGAPPTHGLPTHGPPIPEEDARATMSRSRNVPTRGASEVVVFGRRGVREALAAPEAVAVESVVLSRRAPSGVRREIEALARSHDVAVEVVRPEAVSALTGEPRHDQGVAARVRLLRLMEVEGFLAAGRGAAARRPAHLLALDGVTNSQNVGMIVRSAVASGLGGLLWPKTGSPWINGLVVKASAGTVLRCPIVRCETLVEGLVALQGAGFSLIGLVGGAAETLGDHVPPHRAAYVVGSETVGISEPVAALLDARVRIPMQGGVESLNVAVAASLVCFALAERRGG